MGPASGRTNETPSDDAEGARTVPVGGGRLVSYVEYGAADGRPLVLLHGTPGSHLIGRLFDREARARDVRLLAVDRPGYGRSSPWPGRTLTDTGEVVAAVTADAGASSADLLGFSGGGPHALAVAATHGDIVDGVDVISGAVPPSLAREVPRVQRLLGTLARRAPRLLKGTFRAQAWLVERTSPSVVVSQYTTPEGRAEVPDEVATLVGDEFVEAFARSREGAVTESLLLARDWGFSLAEVDAPVRLWHGERDTNVPVGGIRRLAERLSDARLTVLERADHLTALLRSRSDALHDRTLPHE